ncbi:unnamed protein product [Lathyrus sativus]|nr:unnamed protein product [Lathyrus sativus]
MGFGRRWMKWMDGGVFFSYTSVLVNGRPTRDFKVLKGLRQVDPLSLLFFQIMVEGHAALFIRDVSLDILRGFKINDEVSYSLLQLLDDTVLVCDGSYVGVEKWMDWMDMDWIINVWIKAVH